MSELILAIFTLVFIMSMMGVCFFCQWKIMMFQKDIYKFDYFSIITMRHKEQPHE